MITFEDFSARLAVVRGRMAEACRAAGRAEESVGLLAVTKTQPAVAAEYVARAGLGAVGENRVQEGVEKRPQVCGGGALRWELIGHLQSNKAALAVRTFERIQTVDSEKLLAQLDRAAGEQGRRLAVLLQVNAGRDPAKHGVEPEEAARLLAVALAKGNLRVEGLMTIAPLGANPEEAAELAVRTFGTLRELRDRLAAETGCALPELSMGMSGDLAQAIAAGSTLVRVGSALFGERG